MGACLATRVLRIGFSTDLLSTTLRSAVPAKPVMWVDAAPSGGTTVLDLAFTREDEGAIRAVLANEPQDLAHRLLSYQRLPSGEAVTITAWFSPDADKGFVMPASHNVNEDLVVSTDDPMGTGRPVRLTLYSNPQDRDFMRVWEFGAYWRTPPTGADGRGTQPS